VDYGPPAIEPRFETIHLSSDDPESEEFEDMTVYGYTLKVSKGKVRRARQLEIIDLLRRDPKCLEFVASYQQLLMERNYYMMDQNSDQFEENYEVMQDDKEVSDLYDCMFSCS
jgi:UDP-glucose 6-dehydrogenase